MHKLIRDAIGRASNKKRFEENITKAFEGIKIEYSEHSNGYELLILGYRTGERHMYVGIPKSHPLHFISNEDEFPEFNVNSGQVYVGLAPLQCNNLQLLFEREVWFIGAIYCEDIHGKDPELIRELNDSETADEMLFHESIQVNKGETITYDFVKQQVSDLALQLLLMT